MRQEFIQGFVKRAEYELYGASSDDVMNAYGPKARAIPIMGAYAPVAMAIQQIQEGVARGDQLARERGLNFDDIDNEIQ